MSGAERVLVNALEALRDDGWDVSCASPEGALATALERQDFRRLAIPDLKLPAASRPVAASLLGARTAEAAARLHRYARGADLVLANSLFTLPALRASGTRVPVVWLVHDVIHRSSWRNVLRLTKGRVAFAVAVSEAAAAPLRRAGLEVRVVHNGTSWPVEPLAARPSPPPVVGCAAMLTSWKGQDVLLNAMALLGRDDVVVELAGGHFPKDGPYVRRLEERAAQPDLRGRVRMLGAVPDMLARMRTWTVAVSSSVDPEALPLAVLEAMSIGLPLVGTDHGGTAEVLGDAGVLVAPSNPAAIAAGIGQLLDDGELWARCHRAGPEQVAENFRLDAQIASLASCVAEAVTPCSA
jgi:glycosyltransferase involved in cell wall biosynthesis